MKKQILFYAFTIITSLLLSCTPSNHSKNKIMEIACNTAVESSAPLLSTLLSKIEYIPLETNDVTLGDYWDAMVTDTYIVTASSTGCHVFSRKSGAFIRTIGIIGEQGPSGYASFTSPLYVTNDKVLLKGYKELMLFSLENGALLQTVAREETEGHTYDDMAPLNDTTMIIYSRNQTGENKYNLQIRSFSGNVLMTLPTSNPFERVNKDMRVSLNNECVFYTYNHDIYMHEFTCDTIYRIDSKMNFTPHCSLGLEDKLPPANSREDWRNHYIKFGKIIETDHYLILSETGKTNASVNFGFIHNKTTGKTIHLNHIGKGNGFVNDVDDFINFWPIKSGEPGSNEIWQIIQAEDLIQQANSLHKKHPLLKVIHEEDNPIIIIGTIL